MCNGCNTVSILLCQSTGAVHCSSEQLKGGRTHDSCSEFVTHAKKMHSPRAVMKIKKNIYIYKLFANLSYVVVNLKLDVEGLWLPILFLSEVPYVATWPTDEVLSKFLIVFGMLNYCISKNSVVQNCYSLLPYKSLLKSTPPLYGDLLNFAYRNKYIFSP